MTNICFCVSRSRRPSWGMLWISPSTCPIVAVASPELLACPRFVRSLAGDTAKARASHDFVRSLARLRQGRGVEGDCQDDRKGFVRSLARSRQAEPGQVIARETASALFVRSHGL